MAMATVKKLLNPEALEFKPAFFNLPPPPPADAPFHHLPSPFVPPTYGYCPQPPPQSVVIYYLQHRHFLSIYPPSKPSPPCNYNNQFCTAPKADLMILPRTDEGLGSITFPTSPCSPPQPNYRQKPKPTQKRHLVRGYTGPVNRRGTWVKKSDIPELKTNACYPFGGCTSLMIRNIPVRLSRRELIGLLDEHCRLENEKLEVESAVPLSEFDFLYLPFDFKKKGNLGYAFVNFTNWQGASRLYNSWKGSNWASCSYNTNKICSVDLAKLQGEELKNHFNKSVFNCSTDEFLPVHISPARDGKNAELTKIKTVGTRL